MSDLDISADLRARVRQAAAEAVSLRIQGSSSKDFYGREPQGETLDLRTHRGILSYEPTELVVTARAGTPLHEVEAALEEHGQMLTFEPPRFAPGGTLGGAVASGLAGPRRPWGGAPRDLLLGVKLLDGSGQILNFGGQVMKNVAGYDVSRLMAGAMGTLGVLLELSLKVLPRPPREWTLNLSCDTAQALDTLQRLQRTPMPLSGAFHLQDRLHLRLAGSESSVQAAARQLGAEMNDDPAPWNQLRDHTLAFFDNPRPLWRLSVPPACRLSSDHDDCLIDWGGAQRWVFSEQPAPQMRALAEQVGGQAVLFRAPGPREQAFHPLSAPLALLHKNLKQVFDPSGILNPGRMYAEW